MQPIATTYLCHGFFERLVHCGSPAGLHAQRLSQHAGSFSCRGTRHLAAQIDIQLGEATPLSNTVNHHRCDQRQVVPQRFFAMAVKRNTTVPSATRAQVKRDDPFQEHRVDFVIAPPLIRAQLLN